MCLLLLLLIACADEHVEPAFDPNASRASYAEAISSLDLDSSSIGSSWLEAYQKAIERPSVVQPPIEEVLFFDPAIPEAAGLAFDVQAGRAISIEIESAFEDVFADLYRLTGGSSATEPVHVASRNPSSQSIEFEPRRDGRYLVLIQPGLLAGGKITMRLLHRSALSFPVDGADASDIHSFFGDPRDNGARRHEGIDIFAARGTPVLAASDSVVARVGVRGRGGNIVFLYDPALDLRLYYAHLDTQLVENGESLSAGDVVGTVGNTGNARTTPPHLHLGIYRGGWGGAVDPWNYFVDPAVIQPARVEHVESVGSWFTSSRTTWLADGIEADSVEPVFRNRNRMARRPMQSPVGRVELPEGASLFAAGANGQALRVRTPGGLWGYADPDALSEPTEALTLPRSVATFSPFGDAEIVRLDSGATVTVIGTGRDGLIARLESGLVVAIDPFD